MRNTAEKNLSAMSVKWSSKELANPRALSVIYDWEPITSSLLYLPIIWGWQVYLLFFDDQHVKFIEGQVTEAGASGSDLVSSTAPNKSFRENGSFYFTPKKYQGKNRTWRSRSESGHCVAWERRWPSGGEPWESSPVSRTKQTKSEPSFPNRKWVRIFSYLSVAKV